MEALGVSVGMLEEFEKGCGYTNIRAAVIGAAVGAAVTGMRL